MLLSLKNSSIEKNEHHYVLSATTSCWNFLGQRISGGHIGKKRIDQLQTGCSHHNLYDNCYPLNATFSSKESQMLSAILDFGGHIAFSSLYMTMSYLNGHRIHMDITIFSKIWQIVPKGLQIRCIGMKTLFYHPLLRAVILNSHQMLHFSGWF